METIIPIATGQVEDLPLDTATSTDSNTSTIYHIYHVGQEKRPRNYSIHTIKDSETTIFAPIKNAKSDKSSKSRTQSTILTLQPSQPPTPTAATESPSTDPKSTLQCIQTSPSPSSDDGATLVPIESKPLKGTSKAKKLDNPRHDPRSETAPYFLHLPLLAFHGPPYTLRRAGHKRGPVACLMHASPLWQGWKLEFGDVLEQEGVIDGRGVVNAKFGTRDGKFEGKKGWLKGYKVPKRRLLGESGKKYWQEQKANGFEDNERAGEEKLKPEEVVRLKWASPFSSRTRDHVFEWRGYKFLWKGTSKVENVRKAARMFVWCGHLKLVVLLPSKHEERRANGIPPQSEELCLARYSCKMGNRKAGKLDVFQEAVDNFLVEHILENEVGNETQGGEGENDATVVNSSSFDTTVAGTLPSGVAKANAKTQQRLRDIIFSTALCMLMSERDKRRFLLETLQNVAEVAGG